MQGGVFFGYKCPRGCSRVDIGAVAGSSEYNCSHCGTKMVPDSEGQASAAKVYCPRCKAQYGLVNSDRCPQCGGPFESA